MPDDPGTQGLFGRRPLAPVAQPITLRALGGSFLAGLAGLLAMLPIAVVVPIWLDLFRLDPRAGFGYLLGMSSTSLFPSVFFVIGGVVVVPLFFVVTVTYLPPVRPPALRGVTISLIFWPGFVIGFWPYGSTWTNLSFVSFSLLSHLIYGLVLGVVLQALVGIPEHEV